MTSLAGFDGGVEVSGMSSLEPKKKGRFLVMEQVREGWERSVRVRVGGGRSLSSAALACRQL
jgi:hypothetical protein